MDTIIEAFHIDVKLLIAQAINFAIVLAVLYLFVLRPLTKVMNDRTKKIEKSLEDAKKIDEKLIKTEEDYKNSIAEARKEANAIVAKANQYADKKKQEALVKAHEEIGQIINEEKAQIQQEKAKILKEIKAEVAGLVVESLEKVLEEKIDSQQDEELIKKMLKK
ncbi:MAG: F0F1 ATP synthase subunit B [Candidatus Falkowbacteria bacterium]|nr:F0F1 ATP synthase subunit B [Candidatus Falkowbacteria bacterium]